MQEVLDYLDRLVSNNDKIVVAVSGGPDSMFLLDMLLKVRKLKNFDIIVAHVNHNVRRESYDEAKMVEEYCKNNNMIFEYMIIDKYGTDVARLHVHFLGGYEDNTPWTYDGITGITNFINRVWDLKDIVIDGEISKEHIYEINGLIKKVSDDLENLKLNTAIAALMSFINVVKKDKYITKEELRVFLILLNPLAPHITSEIYENVFGENIIDDVWPKYDEKYLNRSEINLPIQINGKMKKTILVNSDIEDENEVIKLIKNEYPDLIKDNIKKVIYVKGKIINIIC